MIKQSDDVKTKSLSREGDEFCNNQKYYIIKKEKKLKKHYFSFYVV